MRAAGDGRPADRFLTDTGRRDIIRAGPATGRSHRSVHRSGVAQW